MAGPKAPAHAPGGIVRAAPDAHRHDWRSAILGGAIAWHAPLTRHILQRKMTDVCMSYSGMASDELAAARRHVEACLAQRPNLEGRPEAARGRPAQLPCGRAPRASRRGSASDGPGPPGRPVPKV